MSERRTIPMDAPLFDGSEAAAVMRALDPARFLGNESVAEFEQALARTMGIERSIALANGTVALHLAMLACGIGPGDEVLVPSLTFVASANAVRYVGAEAVLVDVDPDAWQMDPADAARRVTARTKAILAVHLYGHACDMAPLRALAREHGLYVIEDCAEALGTTVDGRHVGVDADVATFSFYKNKTITSGEGGAVVTRHRDWHDRLVLLKGQGVPLHRRYWHEVLGYNYRMAPLSAALGTAQLAKLPAIVERKRAIAARYRAGLASLPLVLQREGERSAWWLVAAIARSDVERNALVAHLAAVGVETRPVFLPLQHFPMYANSRSATPNADRISSCGLCFPSGPGLSDELVDCVIDAVRGYFRLSDVSVSSAA
jgi:perosamine synthetase